jgi:hypothetical protein
LRAADFDGRGDASNKSGCFDAFFLVADLAMQSRRWGYVDSLASHYATAAAEPWPAPTTSSGGWGKRTIC